ncbi:(d)CMP kinase [Roseibacillus ishigakijimensis]|uniref:Cytidylate kinase n=1 Tax=Roseibacillus ishigakijimensis TaxID=454146 RepID=A0A934RM12_9BACT|nr:(d)CMP kinase [Roseibacillus ishigakijimensis]MBK1833864.1 (d)CMP kinase [Roseibacillus ishigakijimensis]
MTTFRAIAIDGPAASGKSTVARRLAEDWGLTMVNSGAMYRAVTWEVLRRDIAPEASAEIVALLPQVQWGCVIRDGQTVMKVDEVEPTLEQLKSDEVNAAVSHIAAIPEVRELLVAKQREFLALGDLVMEGRDIGTVVFPDTPYKVFVTASEEVRSQRRAAEGADDAVSERDKRDSERKTSPLRVADGAILVDSSDLAIEEVVAKVKEELTHLGWNA